MKRLLIIGCGDVALRMVRKLPIGYAALPNSPERNHLLREHGITPVPSNFYEPDTLEMLGGLAHEVVHFPPTPSHARYAHCTSACTVDEKFYHIGSSASVPAVCMATAVAKEKRTIRPVGTI
jgi:hypothetical protein